MKKFTFFLLFCVLMNTVFSQKLKKLGINFESTTYNFGDIQMWENQPAVFILTNNSKHPISILPLFSENDLEIIYPEKSIMPGQTATIKAIYYTSGTGSFSRKFPIYFNTSPEAYNLKITGNIKSLSPTAYIQCPMSKPEHAKPKVELAGNVAEIESDIPLSGSVVKIVGVTNKGKTTFFADKNGNFGSKMPTGNYEIYVEHPNYLPHQSFFFLGQNTGYLKIKLVPIEEEPILAQNNQPVITQNIPIKKETIENTITPNNPEKVVSPKTNPNVSPPSVDKEEIDSKYSNLENPISSKEVERVESPAVNSNTPKPDLFETENISTKPGSVSPTDYQQNTSPVAVNSVPVSEEIPTPSTNNTPLKEEEKNSPPPAVTAPPAAPKLTEYTVRIIDEKTLEPIEEAQLYITPILNKKKTQKTKSNEMGISTFPLEKEDYKIIVNADNYISGEAKIKAGQDDEILRIYLSPVSNLFEDIYSEMKTDNEPEDLLSQLSFGRTEFTFAADEEKPTIEEAEYSENTKESSPPTEEHFVAKEETILEEVELKEETVVAPPIPTDVAKVIVPNPSETIAQKEKESLDSIQKLMTAIQQEKIEMELALAQANKELEEKNKQLGLQEEEIDNKEAELNSKENALELAKTNLDQQEEELAKQQKKLEELEMAQVKPGKEEPTNYELSKEDYAANNVLFLIDVSSSMGKENKMELLKESIKSLALVLRDIDRVAIIAYNQKSKVILESVSGENKDEILNAIDSLETSGLTYGVNGLQTAYELLQYYYIGDGNNQIILATDGLFSSANATMTENELNKEVRKQAANNGMRLSVIGFGQDEDGEKLMQKLANNGDGQFIQIKNPWEAKTVLVEEIKINSKY